VWELVPSDPGYSATKAFFDVANDSPEWDCSYESDIRNSSGVSIGERWVCMECR